jgi:hypothetical protein
MLGACASNGSNVRFRPIPVIDLRRVNPAIERVQGNKSLAKQCLIAAIVAAYVGALVSFMLFQIWRYRTGADATMCPVGSNDLAHWCGIGELSLALLFDFLWALYGLPFALVLTIPCAFALGFLAPRFERSLAGRSLSLVQYGLAAGLGVVAGLALEAIVAGFVGGCAGGWAFRRARYSRTPSRPSDAEEVTAG